MFLKFNWPGLLWSVIILILSGIPGNYIPHIISFSEWLGPDKILHVLIYGVLVFLLIRGFRGQYTSKWLNEHAIETAIVIGIIFGLLTEILQMFVFSGRSGNVYDWLADIAGCFIGWGAHHIFFRKKKATL